MIETMQRRWIVAAALGLTLLGTATARSGSTIGAVGRPRTLVRSSAPIVAFAQDGEQIAWLAAGEDDCLKEPRPVRILDLATGVESSLPATRPLCQKFAAPMVLSTLAIAGTRALWAVVSTSNTETDGAFVSAAADDPKERVACGFLLNGGTEDSSSPELFSAGDGRTFVVAVNGEPLGGCVGVRIVDARGRASHLPGFRDSGLVRIAVGGGRIALSTGASHSVQLRSARSGRVIGRIAVNGSVQAVALSRSTVAVLVDGNAGRRIELFDARSKTSHGAVGVPAATASELSAAAANVVFRAGKTIYLLDGDRRTIRILAVATSTPIGLSIEGPRVAWAENEPGPARRGYPPQPDRGRIQAVMLQHH
jgi:hypothetical protein